MSSTGDDDRAAIAALISRQFAAMSWTGTTAGDWDGFARDFLPDAPLYPAARPARQQTVGGFLERMRELSRTTLRSFDETILGSDIHVFGNVAVAVAACGIVENGDKPNRGVEMMLLVKSDGRWRIAAQAWDGETDANPIPPHLLPDQPED